MTARKPMSERRAPKLCGAKTRAGGKCKRPAGAGTDHVGHGRCKLHGGSSPNGRKHAAREQAHELALLLGDGISIEPHEALLKCVRLAAAEVGFFTARIEGLQLEDVTVRPRTDKESDDGYEKKLAPAELNLWVQERIRAVDRLARYSKLAIDAGIAERQVRIAEQFGETIATLLRGVLEDLRLTPEQMDRAREIVPRRLAQLSMREGNAT